MIYLIKDSSEKYISKIDNIVVNNSFSYFRARKLFFLNQFKVEDLEIIISKKSYFNLFLDFQEYKNVVVKEIKFSQDIPIVLEDYFGTTDNIFRILLISKNIDNETLKKMKNRMLNSYFKGYPNSIKSDFMILHPDKVLMKILNCYIFSKYKEYNFNTIMGNNYTDAYKFFKYDKKLEVDFKDISAELVDYLEKSEKILLENLSKISIFSEFNKNSFLNEISGLIPYEKKFYLKKIIEEMNVIRNFSEIEWALKNYKNRFNENLEELNSIIVDLKNIFSTRFESMSSLSQWEEYFFEKYIVFNSLLPTNIEKSIKNIEKKYECDFSEIRKSLKNIWKDCRNNFGVFYLKNYNNIQSSFEKKGLDYAIIENKRFFNNNKKNLIIFIDCLRYDIWIALKSSLEERGIFCQKEETVLSSIPTVTSYCKKILYNGKKYSQLENSNGLEALKELFGDKKFAKIASSEEFFIKMEESNNFLYEILDLDNFFHDFKDIDIEFIKNSLVTKLDKLFLEINKEQFNIIVMTDHGAIKLYNSGLRGIPIKNFIEENGLEVENHGRYLKIFSKYYDHTVYLSAKKLFENEELNITTFGGQSITKNYIETDSFYVLTRENLSNFYLPIVESGKENYFYILYKNNYFPKNTGEYNHGGISLEEVFIPFAIFST
ncbi:MAG: PglZ domain-containing protein, partial [Leptotrichiaceae bacterium]|nr:PglZ domain-containing protein [Leptotrichiaceae bacterium]